jgi:hypothetical protein
MIEDIDGNMEFTDLELLQLREMQLGGLEDEQLCEGDIAAAIEEQAAHILMMTGDLTPKENGSPGTYSTRTIDVTAIGDTEPQFIAVMIPDSHLEQENASLRHEVKLLAFTALILSVSLFLAVFVASICWGR